MALKKTTSAAKWIKLSKGKFMIGKEPNIEEYPAFEGLLIGIAFRDGEFEGRKVRQLVLTFLDVDLYKISMNVSSGYAKQTLAKLPNCDLSKPIELNPTHEGAGTAQRSGMFISQQGNSIKQKWTRDNPGQMPPMEEIIVKGEKQWDDSKQMKWLEEFTMSVIAPKCHENVTSGTPEVAPDDHEEAPADITEEPAKRETGGDVPF